MWYVFYTHDGDPFTSRSYKEYKDALTSAQSWVQQGCRNVKILKLYASFVEKHEFVIHQDVK